MKPVSIVTIKNKVQLYKNNEPANSIELIQLEEVGFELIAQKDLYQIGDKAVYIQPDYNLPDNDLFESFIKPQGDYKKSKLGSNNRIRAIKFDLHRGDNEVTYSNGILLPYSEVKAFLKVDLLEGLDLTALLNIKKWEEEPETSNKNTKSGSDIPSGIYKTDEPNIHNKWDSLNFPITLVGTEKIVGSSITIGIKNGIGFICSRNVLKPLTLEKFIGYRKPTFFERIKMIFGISVDLKMYETIDNNTDDFVNYGKPYLDALLKHKANDIILRGELNGSHLKGSGNKNNPARNESPNIKFFGMDYFENGIAKKEPYKVFKTACEIISIMSGITFNTTKTVFLREFSSKDDLLNTCNEYFKENMIEGIVVRTLDSSFSAKIMSLEYDSKK